MQIGVLLSNAMTFMQCLIVSYEVNLHFVGHCINILNIFITSPGVEDKCQTVFVLISYYLKVLFKDMGLDVSLLCYIWNETIGAHFMYFDFA